MHLSTKTEVDKLWATKETLYGPLSGRRRPYDVGYWRGYTAGILSTVAAFLVGALGGALVWWLTTRGVA